MFGMRAKKRTDEDRDLGFGAVVASSSGERLLNRDGSFNSRREGLPFFVHPIDKDSPLWDLPRDECLGSDAEIMVLLKGIDETFSQTVHARSSYKAHEIIWSAKFTDIYLLEGPNIIGIDLGRLSERQEVTA